MSKIAENLRVSSPCTESWEQMKGTDKIRFCSHCSHEVNDISKMTRREVGRLVRNSNGRICIRYIPDPRTGAPVFSDKIYQISRRSGIAAGVLSATLAMSGAAYAQGSAVTLRSDQETQTQISLREKSDKTESAGAQVSGTLTDSLGAVIPGASVKLSGEGFEDEAVTNENGYYHFLNAPAGILKLTFVAGGFTTKTVSVTLNENSAKNLDTTLEVGDWAVMGMMVSVAYEFPIVQAAADDDIETVRQLIYQGADVNAKESNASGSTALHFAVENGNYELVELLLNSGAKVNIRNEEKRTPLLMLEFDTSADLIRLLLNHGAKISATDEEGNNALHRAAENDDPQVIELLLREGIKINSRNKEGETPLMIAAYYEVPETVAALLRAGADVNLRNEKGETALSIAKGEEGEDVEKIVKLLIQYGARD